jgi:acyl-CoA thioester hydrolase
MTPHLKDDSFFYPTRVYYEDTDAGGVVYHSNYYRLCERARTEWLRAIGIPNQTLVDEHGVMFVARRSSIEWLKPARLDDHLMIETRLSGIGKVRITVRHTVRCNNKVICVIDLELVSVNREIIPTPLPAALLAKLPAANTIEEKKKTKE